MTCNRLLILTRSLDQISPALHANLSEHGQIEIILDQKPTETSKLNPIWIPNHDAEDFTSLMSNTEGFPAITAWSRAFVHLTRTWKEDEAVWFIEDDVAGDATSFRQVIERSESLNHDLSALTIRSREENPDWPWWHTAEGFFEEPWRAFQPL